jgi:uncharacterized RDD family membrane protein YckC
MTAAPTRRRAGFVSRLAALVADTLILILALRGTAWFLLVWERALRRFAPPIDLGELLLVCGPLIVAVYQIVFWCLRGQTPGKWLFGIRVVALGGERVRFGQAVVRLAGYLVSALPFYLGFLWILGRERRGFHDRLARTEVIYARERIGRAPLPRAAGRRAFSAA